MILLLMILALGSADSIYASSTIETVRELAASASDVAIVEIIRRVPVEFEYRGERKTCGYRVEARVLESFKGEGKWIEFVDPLDGDPRESKEKYLAFAFIQLNSDQGNSSPDSLYEAESKCLISASKKFVRAQPRTLLQLRELGSRESGWVLVPSHTALEVDSFRREPDKSGQGNLVSWADVRSEIESALQANRPD
jgi:hypothetical protein